MQSLNTKDVKAKESYDNKYYEVSNSYDMVKRLIDVAGSLVALIIFSPILLIVAIVIKLESRGPVFFAQERVGLNGNVFKMYKFRSMIVDAESLLVHLKEKNEMSGPMFKMKHDPRITKVGKFIRKTSIDEFPQLINVLKGDMSLVGPRPNLPAEVEKFDAWMKVKFSVKPGLTCYWQVSGRNNIDFEDWMKLDAQYVRERNILIDIILIFRTFLLIFGDKNAR